MNQSFDKVERHLYRRQYKTSSGDWSTLFYGIFVDWKGVRRRFPLGNNLNSARDDLGALRKLNNGRHDWMPRRHTASKPRSKH